MTKKPKVETIQVELICCDKPMTRSGTALFTYVCECGNVEVSSTLYPYVLK